VVYRLVEVQPMMMKIRFFWKNAMKFLPKILAYYLLDGGQKNCKTKKQDNKSNIAVVVQVLRKDSKERIVLRCAFVPFW